MLEINLKTRAAAQTTKAYNSMCKFGDKYLGVTDSGLFEIEGYNDSGVRIAARIDTEKMDMGINNSKRFRFFYFGVDTSGYLKLSAFADGVLAFTQTVKGNGLGNIRVPVPRTAQPRYWQIRIENVDGAFFALYSIKALPVVLHPGAK